MFYFCSKFLDSKLGVLKQLGGKDPGCPNRAAFRARRLDWALVWVFWLANMVDRSGEHG